jgi:hypothetical protein
MHPIGGSCREAALHLRLQVWMWTTALVYLVWRWQWRRERQLQAEQWQEKEALEQQAAQEWQRFAAGYQPRGGGDDERSLAAVAPPGVRAAPGISGRRPADPRDV